MKLTKAFLYQSYSYNTIDEVKQLLTDDLYVQ